MGGLCAMPGVETPRTNENAALTDELAARLLAMAVANVRGD
ncbi:hypothetical protein LV78_001111 [Actinosynnema pretiosum]|nr:hypothetical protein [Actinosynnema pretiosum]